MVKSKNLFYLLNSLEISSEKRRIIIDEILRRKDQDFYGFFSSGLLENEMLLDIEIVHTIFWDLVKMKYMNLRPLL